MLKAPKQKLTEYEEFKKDEPEMPDFTVLIDNVVDWLYKERRNGITKNDEFKTTIMQNIEIIEEAIQT